LKAAWLENGSIALAALVLGIMAGFFVTYTFNVNPAMLQVDGATYATVQSLFNRNVRHFLFFIFFFGGAFFPALALAINYRHFRSNAFWMVAAAGVLYLAGVIVLTASVNLPLNYATESWNPQALPADWRSVREAWNSANAWRVAAAFSGFVLCLAALLARTKSPGGTEP
jgi:uncharacterized membrane protein